MEERKSISNESKEVNYEQEEENISSDFNESENEEFVGNEEYEGDDTDVESKISSSIIRKNGNVSIKRINWCNGDGLDPSPISPPRVARKKKGLAMFSSYNEQSKAKFSIGSIDGKGTSSEDELNSNEGPNLDFSCEPRLSQPIVYPNSDYSNCNQLPEPRENEIEFVIENFVSWRNDPRSPERVWSQMKEYKSVKFRLLVFPKNIYGNYRLGSLSAYIAVDPSECFPPQFKDSWVMARCDYQILVINWKDWRRFSVLKNEQFTFSSEDTDRGWVELVPGNMLNVGKFLGPAGQLIVRGQISPRSVDASNFHLIERREIGYIGLKNHGATCYLNSLVQSLFHIGKFRKDLLEMTLENDRAVVESWSENQNLESESVSDAKDCHSGSENNNGDDYEDEEEFWTRCPSEKWSLAELKQAFRSPEDDTSGTDNKYKKVSIALQSIFVKLSTSSEVVTTDELLKSFGWDSSESLTQHDAQELNRLLCDKLEEEIKNTSFEGGIGRLFMGEFENYVECIDVPYKSTRREMFYDLQLDVQDTADIYASLKKYTAEEILEGENIYDAEQYGKQRARKGVRFLRFPPVIQFHLKRFTFDPNRMDMVKINQRFEYPLKLDLSSVLSDAGMYELFTVIVHAGDVSGGHYYVITRPGGDKWWIKFDDEKVYPVSPHCATTDSFGGNENICWDYVRHLNNSSYKAESPVVRLHSAYILFYVKTDQKDVILAEPDPNKVNPYLIRRRQLEENQREKHLEIQRHVQSYIRVRFVTEAALRGHRGFITDSYRIPCWFEWKFPRAATIVDIWKFIDNKLETDNVNNSQLLETRKSYFHGLWYFDLAPGIQSADKLKDIQPFPCHLGETNRRQYSLGDIFSYISPPLKKIWNPSISLLVHPVFLREKSEIRSIAMLSNYIAETRLFLAKFFDPGALINTEPEDQYVTIAGFPRMKFKKDSAKENPGFALFLDLLKTLESTKFNFNDPGIQNFCNSAISHYLTDKQEGSTDPLHVRESCYIEENGCFVKLVGNARVFERLDTSKTKDHIINIVFSIPPVEGAIKQRDLAELYGMQPNTVDVYEDDVEYVENRRDDGNIMSEAVSIENLSESGLYRTRKANEIESNKPYKTEVFQGCNSGSEIIKMKSETSIENYRKSEFINSNSGMPTFYVPSKKYPPVIPKFISCNPVDWHRALTKTNILVTLKLFDPLSIIGQWEDTSGNPVEQDLGKSFTPLVKPTSSTAERTVEDCSPGERTTSGSLAPTPKRNMKKMDESQCRMKYCPVKEVKVVVDLRWPYKLALKRLCWFLGIDADCVGVTPFPPPVCDSKSFFSLNVTPVLEIPTFFLPDGNPGRSISGAELVFPIPTNLEYDRLDELHWFICSKQRLTPYRPLNMKRKELFHSRAQYNFWILPRPLSQFPSLSYASASDECFDQKLVLVRVFNAKVENVGCVYVEVNISNPLRLQEFILCVQKLITPQMEIRGALPNGKNRLVLVGSSFSVQGAACSGLYGQLPSNLSNRIKIVTEQTFWPQLQLYLSGRFKYDTPWRLEPEFPPEQMQSLDISSELPSFSCRSHLTQFPRNIMLTALHQTRERQYFGHPFLFIVSSGDTLKVIKEKLQSLIGVSNTEFSKWKFAVQHEERISFLKDDEIPDFSGLRNPCLLLIHRDYYSTEERNRSQQLHIK